MADKVDPELAAIEVADVGGKKVRLGDLWNGQTAVLVWLRHFGRVACREQAAVLQPHLKDLKKDGVEVAFIGSGAPRYASAFRDEFKLKDALVLSDEPLASYKRAGFRHGALSTFSPRAMLHYARALAAGFRQGKTQGDPLQQGGVMVVDGEGNVTYRYASKTGGDHPPVDKILAATR